MERLCDACHREWLSWLDYRLPHTIPFAAQTVYDTSIAGIRDRMRCRFEEWRRTIQEAQDRIRAYCAADTEHRPAFVPSPAGDQYVLGGIGVSGWP